MTKESPKILLKKRMHKAEIYQKWIYMPVSIRKEFPLEMVVVVKVGEERMPMRINKHGYLNPETALWDKFRDALDFDEHKDMLVFVKHEDGSLEITAEKTRDAPR